MTTATLTRPEARAAPELARRHREAAETWWRGYRKPGAGERLRAKHLSRAQKLERRAARIEERSNGCR